MASGNWADNIEARLADERTRTAVLDGGANTPLPVGYTLAWGAAAIFRNTNRRLSVFAIFADSLLPNL